MMKRFLRLLLLLVSCCLATQATTLTGTFKYPNGTLVNGTLSITLTKPGVSNTCSSPFVVVPTSPVYVGIVNGAMISTPNIVPSECLSTYQPYQAQLFDSTNTMLFSQYWYIGMNEGSYFSPSSGSSYFAPTGLTVGGNSGANPSAVQIVNVLAGFRYGSSSVAVMGGLTAHTASATVTWNIVFPDANYVMMCSYKDATNPNTSVVFVSAITVVTKNSALVAITNPAGQSSTGGTIICRGREPQ